MAGKIEKIPIKIEGFFLSPKKEKFKTQKNGK